MKTASTPALWNVAEAAAYLGVPESTLYGWAHRGTGPRSYKVGRLRKYKREDIDLWLESRVDEPRATG